MGYAQLTEQQKVLAEKNPVAETVATDVIQKTPTQDFTAPEAVAVDGYTLNVDDSYDATRRSIEAERNRLVSVDESTILDKAKALSATFDGTSVGAVLDYFKYDRGIFRGEDKSFTDNFNEERLKQVMDIYGLPKSSESVLVEAKNYEHLTSLAEKEMLKYKSSVIVDNTYGDRERIAADLLVGIATDPTILLTGGAGYLVRAGKLATELKYSARATALASKGKGLYVEQIAEADRALKVVDNMKKALAKGVLASNISFGAVMGAVDDDTSMVEGLFTYGLLSPIDYKLINGIKVYNKVPSRALTIAETTTKDGVDTATETSLKKLLRERKGAGENGAKASKQSRLYGEMVDLTDELDNLKVGSKKYTKLEKRITEIQKEIDELDAIGKPKTYAKTLTEAEQYALKHQIKARLNMAKDIGFRELQKTVKNLNKTISKLKSSKATISKANKLNIAGKEVDDVLELARDIEMNITDAKKALEVVSKTEKNEIAEDMLNIYRSLYNDGHLSKSAIDQLEASYKKGKGLSHPKIEYKLETKGGKNTVKVKINGKIVKTLGASMLAGTVASAYSPQDAAGDAGWIVGVGLLGAILGVKLYHGFKSGAIRQAIKNGIANVEKHKVLEATRDIRAKLGEWGSKTRVSVIETVKPILDNTTGAINQFAKEFYFNPLDTEAVTIGTLKNRLYDTWSFGLEKDLRPLYSEWLKEQDLSKVQDIASMFTDNSLRSTFNKQVHDYMKMGKYADSKAVVSAAKATSKYYDTVLGQLEELLGKSIRQAKDGLMYVPRVVKGLEFANKITGISEESKQLLIKRFASMLTKTKNPEAVAEAYISNMIRFDVTAGKTFSKDARASLVKELKAQGLSGDAIDEIIDNVSGTFGRTKDRLYMDYEKFGEFNVDINGVPVKITIDDLFHTDISSVSNTLFNQASGHVALAQKGYKSVDDVISMIKDANMLESHRTTMLKDVEALVGVPAIDYTQTFNSVMKGIGNIAIGKMMVLSVLSLGSEGIVYLQNVLSHSGVFKGMKKIANDVIGGFGEDSFVANSKVYGADGLGFAQSRLGSSYGQFRTFDEMSGINSGIGRFLKYTEMYRDFVLHTLPFTRTSDFIAKANIQDILDRLYSHFDGTNPLKSYELSAYPITPRMEKYLRENMKLNKQGHVQFFDYTKESYSLQNEFRSLMNNMMMKRMNMSTMGTTAAFSRNSALGVAFMPMLKYPMSAYANIGGFLGRGILQGDSSAMIQTVLWFQAGIAQSIIRNEITGRDYDETDLMFAGFTNMPMYGLYGTVVGLGDSPTSKMMSDITSVLNIYTYVKEK